MRTKQKTSDFGFSEPPKEPRRSKNQWRYQYDCIYRIKANTSINKITLRFKKENNYGLNPDKNYSIAIFESDKDSWDLINTKEIYKKTAFKTF